MQISYDKDRVIYAGFFSRLAAFLIDSALVTAALSIFKFIVWIIKLAVGDVLIFKPILFTYNVFDIVFYLLSVGYFILMTYFCGATIGKFLMKLKVVDVEGQKLSFMSVLMRETVGRYLSALVMYAGYIIVGFDNRKQGLHDKISDTLVIYTHPQPVKKPATIPMPQGRPPMPQGRSPMSVGGQPVLPGVPMQAAPQSMPTGQMSMKPQEMSPVANPMQTAPRNVLGSSGDAESQMPPVQSTQMPVNLPQIQEGDASETVAKVHMSQPQETIQVEEFLGMQPDMITEEKDMVQAMGDAKEENTPQTPDIPQGEVVDNNLN